MLTIYAKTGGKGGRHSWVTDSSNIMAVSNIAVQVFEHQFGAQFRDVPHVQTLHVHHFDLIRPSAFLCALKHTPEFTQHGLKISTEDWDLFKKVKDNGKQVLLALKSFGTQAREADDIE